MFDDNHSNNQRDQRVRGNHNIVTGPGGVTIVDHQGHQRSGEVAASVQCPFCGTLVTHQVCPSCKAVRVDGATSQEQTGGFLIGGGGGALIVFPLLSLGLPFPGTVVMGALVGAFVGFVMALRLYRGKVRLFRHMPPT